MKEKLCCPPYKESKPVLECPQFAIASHNGVSSKEHCNTPRKVVFHGKKLSWYNYYDALYKEWCYEKLNFMPCWAKLYVSYDAY